MNSTALKFESAKKLKEKINQYENERHKADMDIKMNSTYEELTGFLNPDMAKETVLNEIITELYVPNKRIDYIVLEKTDKFLWKVLQNCYDGSVCEIDLYNFKEFKEILISKAGGGEHPDHMMIERYGNIHEYRNFIQGISLLDDERIIGIYRVKMNSVAGCGSNKDYIFYTNYANIFSLRFQASHCNFLLKIEYTINRKLSSKIINIINKSISLSGLILEYNRPDNGFCKFTVEELYNFINLLIE